jgi:hypothetical protein
MCGWHFFHCVLVLTATNGWKCEKICYNYKLFIEYFYNQNKFYRFCKKAMALNWNALKRVCQFKQTHFHKKYFKFDSWNIVSFQKCFTKKYLKIIFLLLNRSWEKNQNDFLIWNKCVKQNTCQRLHF